MSDQNGELLDVSVWRGDESGEFETFQIPRRANQTVLDAVTLIQRTQDPTLSYRFACRVGMCGSCAMTVNGKARWTCRTHVDKVAEGGKLEIGPLANLPIIKDLTCDMTVFFEKMVKAKGYFQGEKTRKDDFAKVEPESAPRISADEAIECIGCGVCYASCDVINWNSDYLGPAALNRAWSLAQDERDINQSERLAAVSGDAGCHSCHTHMSCTERCPKHLSPTRSIAGLKKLAAKASLKGDL